MPLIENPYRTGTGMWLRGNLHTHTTDSDGPLSPQDTVNRYAELGYDFIALTDHDQVAAPEQLDSRGLVLIPGNEITADGPHILHVGTKERVSPDPDRQRVLDAVCSNGGFAVMCHPNWEPRFNHCPQELLEALIGYTGIEIYNGVVSWVEGNPLAMDRWDMLLSQGRHVWGFADDDCHIPTDHGVAWNMVYAASKEIGAIIDAMRRGSFYASTGVTIDKIELAGDTINLRAPSATRIAAYSDHGRRPAAVNANEISFKVPQEPGMTYVRFECFGPSDKRAWTQPFFIR